MRPAVERSIQLAMTWQPMPGRAVLPAGTRVHADLGAFANSLSGRLAD